MKSFILALSVYFTLLLRQIVAADSKSCFSHLPLRTTDEVIQRHVDQLVESKEDIPVECLTQLLSRGYHSIALSLYEDYFAIRAESNSPLIRQSATIAKRELETFTNIIMASKQEVQVVEPVFQWAQNKSHVFIQVKLAMRLDSPACLTCREEVVRIENRTLFMSAFGVISHSPVRFILNLSLSDDINLMPESAWNYESVGTYFFSLSKQNATNLWIDLESTTTRKVQVWWDMREKHKVHMDEWSRLKEEAADQAESQRREARRKAKQEKKQARLETQKAKKEKMQKQKQDEEEQKKKDSSWGSWFSNLTN